MLLKARLASEGVREEMISREVLSLAKLISHPKGTPLLRSSAGSTLRSSPG